ncbi:MAG TPA: hypothetical protein VFA07_06320 [Chthonomonadaceae bacterium]|nr:hypothetical protein [Chthonomonadaceae bacterium]
MELVGFINKWLHLLSIIGTLGGIAFAWLVLVPAARNSPPGTEVTIRGLWRRFGISLGILWLVVLLTGFYNVILVSPTVVPTYHMLVGAKIMLVILMFLLSLAMGHPIPALERMQQKRAFWLLVVVLMGIVVVGISTYLNLGRMSHKLLKSEVTAAPATTTPPGARP